MNLDTKKLSLVIVPLALLLVLLGWFMLRPAATPRNAVPPVSLSLLDGSKPMLAAYRGKVVLGVFWSVSCTICSEEIPHLNALYNRRKDHLLVIGFDMPYDRPDWAVKFIKERPIQYPVSLDLNGDIARAFGGVQATPTTVLIDKHGRMVWKKIGRLDFARLEKEIESLAQES